VIYQLEVLYGALINGKVIYSTVTNFEDCRECFSEPFDEIPFKELITKQIIEDGFNPNDFVFSYITKEQYENRVESKETCNLKFNE